MRVLLVKTSSMGDLIHTLPALSDAGALCKEITFDWVVEDTFVEIPYWHPRVRRVIPVALRRWRKGIFSRDTKNELKRLRYRLREEQYDLILDAQGLVKSAFLTFFAKGVRAGLDFHSAREAFASFAYQQKHTVYFYQHAVVRMRSLFSQAFKYPMPVTPPDFGIHLQGLKRCVAGDYLVFLHGTSWTSKQWPETYWITLAELAAKAGLRVKISGGSDDEVARALRIAKAAKNVDVMPRLNITEMANLLIYAKGVVAVDTGFGHLASALNVPTVSLYGSTNATYTGALGKHSIHLTADFPCAPCLNRLCHYKKSSVATPACFTTLPPFYVWEKLKNMLALKG